MLAFVHREKVAARRNHGGLHHIIGAHAVRACERAVATSREPPNYTHVLRGPSDGDDIVRIRCLVHVSNSRPSSNAQSIVLCRGRAGLRLEFLVVLNTLQVVGPDTMIRQ